LTKLPVICTLAGRWGKLCDLITLHQSQ